MSSHPYLPLYVGAYLKNTKRLTAEEHGAYLLLLMELWTNGGEIQLDTRQLARIACVSPKRWTSIWKTLEPFFDTETGMLRQPRLDLELLKADQISEKRKHAGERGNFVKALKKRGYAVHSPTQLRTQTGTHPDHTIKKAPLERAESGPTDDVKASSAHRDKDKKGEDRALKALDELAAKIEEAEKISRGSTIQ